MELYCLENAAALLLGLDPDGATDPLPQILGHVAPTIRPVLPMSTVWGIESRPNSCQFFRSESMPVIALMGCVATNGVNLTNIDGLP